ncbi:hypothetical protein [Janthinobacterium lividum]|uniref:hypothetical protein n=1 Tax=Janthinobacterium lividum TaxID=29581 RepID=UPI000874DD2B|nr:hypothetical protein [Janthinobacterium lividum]MCC7713164.1 hypothetical protein [Janthinobacterium lividum]OEZ57316.1 hypothetical protein JANLI_24430 [Janthinobacterium lividum]WQE26239.1 hypothetical protein U0004_14620 [Janthinobacterium lividum]STQ97126.1 Uncharacterised protein [Janthinobacterium lividum]
MSHQEALSALGLSEAMLRHLDGDSVAAPLDYHCRAARAWRSSPIAGRGIVPLWECGMVLDYFNPANGRFERCSLENIDEVWCSYASLQGLLAELFLNAYEDEVDDAALCACASLFGFHAIQRLLAEAANAGTGYKHWRTGFGASCTDH